VEALVSQSDVEAALLRPLTELEAAYIDWQLDAASTKLRTKRRVIDTQIAKFNDNPDDPEGVDPAAVAAMLAEVIKRYMANPDGASSKSETVGPFAHTSAYTAGKAVAGTGQLIITDEDLAQLSPATIMAGTLHLRTHRRRDVCHPWV
jgi:hypothetical protein